MIATLLSIIRSMSWLYVMPMQAACNGITYSQLIDMIIDKSLTIKR